MQPSDWLIRGTAWLAFLAWLWFTAFLLRRPATPARGHAWVWWFGGALMLVHTLLAFHRVHDWSHAAAVADTARQTLELTGTDWGGGVWLNYLLATIWLLDATWRITLPDHHQRRPRWFARSLHGFLGFMWFNATVVFGSPPIRWLGGLGFFLLAILAWRQRAQPSRLPAHRDSA